MKPKEINDQIDLFRRCCWFGGGTTVVVMVVCFFFSFWSVRMDFVFLLLRIKFQINSKENRPLKAHERKAEIEEMRNEHTLTGHSVRVIATQGIYTNFSPILHFPQSMCDEYRIIKFNIFTRAKYPLVLLARSLLT